MPFPASPSSGPSTSLAAPLPPLLPPAPQGLALGALPLPPRPSRRTIPEPYPKIELCGFGAGGKAGNISPPLLAIPPRAGPLLAGLLVGAEGGFDEGAEEGAIQGTVFTFPAPVLLFGGAEDGGGRPGNGFAELEALDAVPHDRVCETDERDDAAVEDLSFRTRVDFGPPDCVVDELEAVAQLRGMGPLGTLGPGSEG